MENNEGLIGRTEYLTEQADQGDADERVEAKSLADENATEERAEETVSIWLAGGVIVALVMVFILSGLIIKSLYIEQPVARTAVERDIFKYKELVQKNPKDIGARISLADAYIEAKEYEAAERELREVVEISPRSPRPHERLAEIHQARGKTNEAVVEYKRAIELDPRDEIAYYQLGRIYLSRNQYDKAATVFKRFVDLNPSVADGHYYLGFATEKMGDKRAAALHYSQALKYVPDYSEAKEGLDRVSQ